MHTPSTQFDILQAIAAAHIACDGQGGILAANPAAVKLLGYEADALRQNNLYRLASGDTSHVERALTRWSRSSQTLPAVLRLRNAAGEMLEVRCRGARLRGGNLAPGTILFELMPNRGANQAFLALSEKVQLLNAEATRRRDAERKLAQLVEGTASTGKQFFFDLARHLAHAMNVRYALVNELNDREHVTTLAFWDGQAFRENFSYPLRDTPCEDVYKNGLCLVMDQVASRYPNDEDLKSLGVDAYLGILLCDQNGQAMGHVCVLDDKPITDSEGALQLLRIFAARAAAEIRGKNAHQALNRANRDLEQRVEERTQALREALVRSEAATRIKSQFLANMSHEIRTPMNGVLGMLNLLSDTRLAPVQRDYVDTAINSGNALLTLINDILDLSKIEAGRLELDPRRFDIRACIEESVALLAQAAADKGLELAIDIDESVPVQVEGDAARLRQILVNLTGNAVKFTARGEIYVCVEADKSHGEQREIRFQVHDTGVGISEEAQTHIFESFRQEDGSTTRRFGGTGLGLSISRQLARLMGGDIQLESTPGVGSIFKFTARFQECARETARMDALPELGAMRVLVVDDNATNRAILVHMLDNWNIPCATATHADEALLKLADAALAGRPFNLALLDMMMPEVDGLRLAETIKQTTELAATGLILISSISHSELLSGVEDLPVDHALSKPVRQSSLFDAMVSVMQDKQSKPLEAPPIIVTPQATRGERILVVEDNTVNQKVALGMLKRLGLRADLAGNGEVALNMLMHSHYDLVLMDCQMPVMNGYQATAAIRRLKKNAMACVPIIAMTANAMKGDNLECLQAGMNDYLSKPIDIGKLKMTLDKWLRRENAADKRVPTRNR